MEHAVFDFPLVCPQFSMGVCKRGKCERIKSVSEGAHGGLNRDVEV